MSGFKNTTPWRDRPRHERFPRRNPMKMTPKESEDYLKLARECCGKCNCNPCRCENK